MNEDYLWDKTGEDSEIKELENRLKTFRVSNMAPPTLPAKTFVIDRDSVKQEKPNRFFQVVFASFACLGLIAISIGFVRVFQTENPGSVRVSPAKILNMKKASEKPEKRVEKISEKKKPTEPTITRTVLIKQSAKKPRVYKATIRTPGKVKRTRAAKRKIRRKTTAQKRNEDTIVFTQEEKDAYEQLMKALTITSTKLKIVRDKVNGAE